MSETYCPCLPDFVGGPHASPSSMGWWDCSSLCGPPGLPRLQQPGALRAPRNVPGLGWPAVERWACQASVDRDTGKTEPLDTKLSRAGAMVEPEGTSVVIWIIREEEVPERPMSCPRPHRELENTNR